MNKGVKGENMTYKTYFIKNLKKKDVLMEKIKSQVQGMSSVKCTAVWAL